MTYQVGIDLGTTYSAAAVCRPGDGPAEVVPLGQRSRSVPSAVFAGPDGAFLVGEAAERRALSDPGRVVREFKRRIGDATPLLVGREPVAAEELAARFISRVLDAVAEREGAVASRVAVTHPAGWGQHKVGSLRAALAEHGLGSAVLLTEPQAAAVGYASAERVERGAIVAVYDLGGGTFDAAVVRKSDDGGFELLGTPEGIERLGGVDFDEVVFEHVRAALGPAWEALDPADPEVLAAVAGLRRECTAAKEALSHDTEVLVPVMLPGACTQVRLGRTEFEEMIRPAVSETIEAMRRALDSAGVSAADLTALLLVGGSSRIPLITQLVSAEFGRSASVDVDPKGVIAAGAALVARGTVAQAPAGPRVPARPLAPAALDVPAGPAQAADVPAAEERPGATVAIQGAGPALAGPAARPPKGARPFAGGTPAAPAGGRRVVLGVAAGALVLVLLGGAVAFGVARIGAGREAGAATPQPATVSTVVPGPAVVPEPVVTSTAPPPAPRAPRPAARGGRQTAVAPPTQAVPPAATTTAPPPTSTAAPEPGGTGEEPPADETGAGAEGGAAGEGTEGKGAAGDAGAGADDVLPGAGQDDGGPDGAGPNGAGVDGAGLNGGGNDGSGKGSGGAAGDRANAAAPAEQGANGAGAGAGAPARRS